jgi:hypothetical protein
MGMAAPSPTLKWDDAHTSAVPMTYVNYDSPTGASYTEVGPRFTIRVCSGCRKGRTLCLCAWRKA